MITLDQSRNQSYDTTLQAFAREHKSEYNVRTKRWFITRHTLKR